MQEIELKFQIPAAALPGVRQALQRLAGAQPPASIPMRAVYFDTPDAALAQHKAALRVRQEGPEWVQTLKAAGADAMTRVEDNQSTRPPADGPVRPDLSLHRSPGAIAALTRALGWQPEQDPTGAQVGLQPWYETRFERRQQTVQQPAGQVLVCLDEGKIESGPEAEALAELELELLSGNATAVLDEAQAWVDQHGVWLDVQSKAMRGARLARARTTGHPAAARPVPAPLPPAGALPPAEARTFLSRCLDSAAGNWSEVAALRPGWAQALRAWHDTLHTLHQVGQHAGMRPLLPEPLWAATEALQASLAALQPGAEQATQAQALATGPQTTHWGLGLLRALR